MSTSSLRELNERQLGLRLWKFYRSLSAIFGVRSAGASAVFGVLGLLAAADLVVEVKVKGADRGGGQR
jgi:hypothetical protein